MNLTHCFSQEILKKRDKACSSPSVGPKRCWSPSGVALEQPELPLLSSPGAAQHTWSTERSSVERQKPTKSASWRISPSLSQTMNIPAPFLLGGTMAFGVIQQESRHSLSIRGGQGGLKMSLSSLKFWDLTQQLQFPYSPLQHRKKPPNYGI